jgi:hypothetical protein
VVAVLFYAYTKHVSDSKAASLEPSGQFANVCILLSGGLGTIKKIPV